MYKMNILIAAGMHLQHSPWPGSTCTSFCLHICLLHVTSNINRSISQNRECIQLMHLGVKYRVGQKTAHQTHDYNSAKFQPILEILLLEDYAVRFDGIMATSLICSFYWLTLYLTPKCMSCMHSLFWLIDRLIFDVTCNKHICKQNEVQVEPGPGECCKCIPAAMSMFILYIFVWFGSLN